MLSLLLLIVLLLLLLLFLVLLLLLPFLSLFLFLLLLSLLLLLFLLLLLLLLFPIQPALHQCAYVVKERLLEVVVMTCVGISSFLQNFLSEPKYMTVSRLLVCWWFVNLQLVIIVGFCTNNNNDDHSCYDCYCDQQQTISNHMRQPVLLSFANPIGSNSAQVPWKQFSAITNSSNCSVGCLRICP